jgi:putative tricarboxylic transport membrane protein
MTERQAPAQQRGGGLIRSPQDATAGLFLVVLAGIALFEVAALDTGTLRAFGPGMLPRALAVILGGAGVALIVISMLKDGSALDRWSIRGPFFILGSVLAFAFTIRNFGLAVAGPLAMMLASCADREVKPAEIALFAVVLTGACIVLFKYILGLPIPVLKLP